MSDQWYYRKGGETRGPLSRQQLEQLARAGEIEATTLVWRAGFPEWISLAAVSAAGSAQAPPPPPPPPPPAYPPPSPKYATQPRSARQPPVDNTRWAVFAGVGIVLALLAAGVVGWVARGITSAPRDGLSVAAKPANSRALPAAKGVGANAPAPHISERSEPAPTKSPFALDAAAADVAATDAVPPPTVSPPAGESPANTKAVEVPPSATPSEPAPPSDSTSPPAASGQGSSAGTIETLFQEVDVQRAPTFAILGTETTQNLHYQMLSELRVGPPDERGNRKVGQTVKNARLVNADDLSRGMFEDSLRKFVGWQFSYRLNAGGEVLELTSGPADGRRAAPVKPMGGTGFLLTSVMDEAGWKELAQLSFFVPDPQARGNQPLVRQMTHDFGPLGSWSGTTKFQRQGTQKGVQQFDYVHEMTYKPPEKGAGDLPFAVADAKFVPDVAGGSIYFDTKTRRVQAAQDRFQVRGEISADILGQAATIQVQEQQAITVRLFDQDPWSQNRGAAGSRRPEP